MKWIAVAMLTFKTLKEAMDTKKGYDSFIYMAFPTVVMWMMVLGGIE